MLIKKIVIKNFKALEDFKLEFNQDLNIIVGDNETGKSTLLEAINLALTNQINGRNIDFEISPYLFSKAAVDKFKSQLINGEVAILPEILVELYFEEAEELNDLRGSNNSEKENSPGVKVVIEFNSEYTEEYKLHIADPKDVRHIPVEYYRSHWYSFANNSITARSMPINTTFIDATSLRLLNGIDFSFRTIIAEALDSKEKADLTIAFRKLKEDFASQNSLKSLNNRLQVDRQFIANKDLSVSMDVSQKTSWEANLTSYLDEIPFQNIGKGNQNILKMLLALGKKKTKNSDVILIEEPENHLSFSTMNLLIDLIADKCREKQLIITTHSAFVLNKLGIEKVILLGRNKQASSLKALPPDTQRYFKKLPGYDTLRLILAKKSILVEGPSDELFIQKAYLQQYNKLPILDGIDVISVRGLSFKRFLEIARLLGSEVRVVTDNDGDYAERVEKKYTEYLNDTNITICYDKDDNCPTLEPQIVKINDLNLLNSILDRGEGTKNDLARYMEDNKAECALKIFESSEKLAIPEYIKNAIN